MRIIKQRKFTIGQQFLPELVNGDSTGMDDGEEICLGKFCEHHRLVNVVYDVGEEVSFARCDVSGLAGDCYEVTISWLSK